MINVSRTLLELNIDVLNDTIHRQSNVYWKCPQCKREYLKKYHLCFSTKLCRKCSSINTLKIINDNVTTEELQNRSLKYYATHDGPNKGRKFGDDFKEKISKAHKGKKLTDEHKEKIRQTWKKKIEDGYVQTHSLETRKKMSLIQQEIVRSGKKKIRGKNIEYIDRKGNRLLMKSTWEYKFAIYLDGLNVDWEYETKSFELLMPDGKTSFYFPDFYIPDTDEFIEVKGRWYPHSKIKFECFLDQYYDNETFTSDMTVVSREWLKFKNIL